MLSESLAKEKADTQVRDKAQGRVSQPPTTSVVDWLNHNKDDMFVVHLIT